MEAKLKQTRNWELLADTAKYRVSTLAVQCHLSARQLERFFATEFGEAPHKWLHELRMQGALELMRDCSSVKEAAYQLGYKDATHLTHDFKKHFGISPSKAVASGLSVSKPSQMSHFDRRCRV
jgi:AraC-like DNA-binding protein